MSFVTNAQFLFFHNGFKEKIIAESRLVAIRPVGGQMSLQILMPFNQAEHPLPAKGIAGWRNEKLLLLSLLLLLLGPDVNRETNKTNPINDLVYNWAEVVLLNHRASEW